MWCGWGFYFRRPFEGQAGNRALQAQSKPPAVAGGYDFAINRTDFLLRVHTLDRQVVDNLMHTSSIEGGANMSKYKSNLKEIRIASGFTLD